MTSSNHDASSLKVHLVSGGLWRIRPVDDEPRAHLEAWRVFEVDGGGRHLVGRCLEEDAGRVTSAIQDFDPKLRRCLTRSGRLYELQGAPGFDPDADYVWANWRKANRVTSCVDVTDEYERRILEQATDGGEAR